MQNGPSPEQRAQLGAVGAATGLGCAVVVTLIAFIGGGVVIDGAADTAPVFTLLGVALGLLAAGYQLYELTLIGRKDRAAGPLGRQFAKLPGSKRAPAAGQSERDKE